MYYNPTAPHKNLIILLHMAGLAINKGDGILSIEEVLREYEYNPLPNGMYEEIIGGADKNPGVMVMHNTNYEILNGIKKERHMTRKLYFDNDVMEAMPWPKVCKDLILYFASNELSKESTPGVITNGIIRILNDLTIRQSIEIMLMRDIPINDIVTIYNDSSHYGSKITREQVSAYREYFWNVGGRRSIRSEDQIGLTLYLSICGKSKLYEPHRLYSNRPVNEVLAALGYVPDNTRSTVNRIIYGLASTEVVDSLRTKGRVKESVMKLYMHADGSIADEKKSADVNDLRKEVSALFRNVEVVAEKRMSISQMVGGTKDEEEPEQDQRAFPDKK